MDKPILISFVLLVACLFGQSSSHAQSGNSDVFSCAKGTKVALKEGQGIIGKAESAYNNITSFSADFVQNSYLATLDSSELSQGKMWFSRPGKMKWEYLDPELQTFVLNNQTIWFYQKAENQVLVDDFKNVLLQDVPVSFVLGMGKISDNFELKKMCKSEYGVIAELAPKGASKASREGRESLTSFKLLLDDKDFLPQGAEVVDSSKNSTAITFRARMTGQALPDSNFVAAFPKNADVIDRRKEG